DAGILQLPGRIENRLVFDLTGDDMPTRNTASLGDALESEVVRFSGAGGPDDLRRLCADQLGHLSASVLNRLSSLLAEGMRAGGRVTEVTAEPQTVDHHPDHPLIHRRGGGIVEIQRTFIHKRKLAERVPGSGMLGDETSTGANPKVAQNGRPLAIPDRMQLKEDNFS